MPDQLNEGIVYVSVEYAVAIHKCICGCGKEVVTPLSPTDWQLTFDGETISLYPSIGNWNFKCRSHYWIKRNKILHAAKWDEIETKREKTVEPNKKKKQLKERKTKKK